MDDREFYEASQALPQGAIKTAKKSIRCWKITAFACLVIILLQCILISHLVNTQSEYVYVAEASAGGEIENVIPLGSEIKADQTVKMAFIKQYISRLMSLSLDPVVVRRNWMEDYNVSGISARKTLSQFIQSRQMVSKIGKETREIKVRTFNAISDDSFQFTWDETSYDQSGKKKQTIAWSGVFTLTTRPVKGYGVSQLFDPFGLQVESFSLNQLGA